MAELLQCDAWQIKFYSQKEQRLASVVCAGSTSRRDSSLACLAACEFVHGNLLQGFACFRTWACWGVGVGCLLGLLLLRVLLDGRSGML